MFNYDYSGQWQLACPFDQEKYEDSQTNPQYDWWGNVVNGYYPFSTYSDTLYTFDVDIKADICGL